MIHRREIDGLRAVAVLPVILFHAGVGVFSGGYVGVDVFFVISGFLITSILIEDVQNGRFSLLRFYERRARRILPALSVVMLACIPFAYLWMAPMQFKDFGISLASVVLFASNVLFWLQDDYFAGASELKPLLHTWSLAVEEQFYFFFPLVIAAFWRFGRNRVFVLVLLLALASLVFSEYASRHWASMNYYLISSRAWELLAGSICAFLGHDRMQRSHDGLAALGLVLIVIPVFLFDEQTRFPSLFALAPVGGAALVILFADDKTRVGKVLSCRPLVWVGLISYSAYLWHQPVFAFARLRAMEEPPLFVMLGLCVLTLGLAWLSWAYVEQPFRRGKRPLLPGRLQVFGGAVAVGIVIAGIGAWTYVKKGFPDRVPLPPLVLADLTQRALRDSCFDFKADQIKTAQDWFCIKGAETDYTKTVVVMGDSHSLSFFGPMAD